MTGERDFPQVLNMVNSYRSLVIALMRLSARHGVLIFVLKKVPYGSLGS